MKFLKVLREEILKNEQRLKECRREMVKLPGGNLIKRSKGSRVEYYLCNRGNEIYLRKHELAIANDVMRRKVLEREEYMLQRNINRQKKLFNSYEIVDHAKIQSQLPKSYQLYQEAEPLFKPGEHVTEADGSHFFRQSENEYKRDELVNATYFGLKTRSKSEAMIAETLYRNGFSLYYEKRLFLADIYGNPRTLYPDFTIPIGRKDVIYWEHKGLLDSDEYVLRDAEKTRLYHINDIYPPFNMIITADRPGGGLDNEYLDYLVKGFLGEIKKNHFIL